MFNYLRQLFKDSFIGGDHHCKVQLEILRGLLQTRGWIIYSIDLVYRLVKVMLGVADWQIAYGSKEEKLAELDQSFVDQTESYVKGAEIFMLVLGVLLTLITSKHRQYARYLIYARLLTRVPKIIIPYDGPPSKQEVFLEIVIMYLSYACGTGSEIIALTLVTLV